MGKGQLREKEVQMNKKYMKKQSSSNQVNAYWK